MGAQVYTIEIVEPLAEMARQTLERLGYKNARVKSGDGFRGWPEHAPFDAIIVTCAPDKIPPDLVAQLRDGGRMIIPVGSGMNQELVLLRKTGDKIEQQSVLPVRFVPMTGEAQAD
jgi:protein-L-isoaspartate(D-aspartate) O-methyltransferase